MTEPPLEEAGAERSGAELGRSDPWRDFDHELERRIRRGEFGVDPWTGEVFRLDMPKPFKRDLFDFTALHPAVEEQGVR